MSGYIGSWNIDDALVFYAQTHNASTGAVTDDDSAPTYRIYENNTDTPLLTGSMSVLDNANTVGLYAASVTLSAANGFEVSKNYCIRVLGTVATVTGGALQTFQIRAPVNAASISYNTTVADNMETVFTTMTSPSHFGLITAGTAQAVADNSIDLAAGFAAANDVMIGATVYITSSTNGLYGRRYITDWDNTTKRATVDPAWNDGGQTPSGTVVYAVFATAPSPTSTLQQVDLRKVGGNTIPATNQNGVPIVDVSYIQGVGVDTATGQFGVNVVDWKGSTAPAMTGDAFARLGAPAGASVSADVAAIKVDSAAILIDTGTTLDTAITTIDSNVDAILADTGTDGVVVAAASKTGYTLAADFRVKKNTALAAFPFVMIAASDHVTPKTTETVTATRSIDGAAFGACANSVTEIANGWYKIDLDAADLNGDTIALRFSSAGADPTNITIVTQTE